MTLKIRQGTVGLDTSGSRAPGASTSAAALGIGAGHVLTHILASSTWKTIRLVGCSSVDGEKACQFKKSQTSWHHSSFSHPKKIRKWHKDEIHRLHCYTICPFFNQTCLSVTNSQSQVTHILGKDIAPIAAEASRGRAAGGAGCLGAAAVHHPGATRHFRDAQTTPFAVARGAAGGIAGTQTLAVSHALLGWLGVKEKRKTFAAIWNEDVNYGRVGCFRDGRIGHPWFPAAFFIRKFQHNVFFSTQKFQFYHFDLLKQL